MDVSIRRELARLFPDHPLVEVPLDHPIYHLVYDFPKGIPKIHVHDGKPAQGFGIFLDGRLAVYYSYQSDLGDGWEDFEVHHDPPGEARGRAAHGRESVRLRGRVRRVTAPATHAALRRLGAAAAAPAPRRLARARARRRSRCCSVSAAWMVRLGLARGAVLGARWRGAATAAVAGGGGLARMAGAGRPLGGRRGRPARGPGCLAPGHAHRAARPRRRPAPAATCSSTPTGCRRRTWPGVVRRPPSRSPGRCGSSGSRAGRARPRVAGLRLGRADARCRRRAVAPAPAPGRPPWRRCGSAPLREVVDRGDSAALALEAFGRRTATLWLRAPGEGWRPRGVRLDSPRPRHGHDRTAAERRLRPAHQRQPRVRYGHGSRAAAGVSRRARRDGPLPGAISASKRSRCPPGATPCCCPPGTRLETRGEATAPLAQRGVDRRRPHAPTSTCTAAGSAGASSRPRRASIAWRSPPWAGRRSPSDTVRLPVRLVADSAPQVDVPVPGADTLAPLEPAGAPRGRRPRRPRRHQRRAREPADQPPRRGRFGPARDDRRSRTGRPTAPFSPTRSISTGAGCSPATPSATSPSPPTTRRSGRSAAPASTSCVCPTMSEVRAAQRLADGCGVEPARFGGRREQTARAADRRPGRRSAPARRTAGREERRVAPVRRGQEGRSVAESQQELMQQAEELKRSLEALTQERRGGGAQRLGVAARAVGHPGAARPRALSRAARAAAGAAAGAQGSRRRAHQGRARASGRSAEGAARGARAEPRAVPARRARGRPGQPEQGIEGAGAGAARVEPAGRHGR